jgi:exopolysaccharide biosynthesis polyprenyl glycosylphosphotransferase
MDTQEFLQHEKTPPSAMPRLGGDRYLLPLFLLAMADALVFAASIWLAYPIRFYSWLAEIYPLQAGWTVPPFGPFFKFGLVAALVGMVTFERLGFYNKRIGMDRKVHILRILLGVLVANVVLQILLSVTETPLSRGTRMTAVVLTVPLAVLAHYALKHAHHDMIRGGFGYRRTLLLVKTEEDIGNGLSHLEREHGSEFQVSGVLLETDADEVERGKRTDRVPQSLILGNLTDLRWVLATEKFDTVVVLLPAEAAEEATEAIRLCEVFEVEFFLAPDLFERMLDRVSTGGDVLMPVLAMGETPLSGSSLVLKRIIDLVGSSCLILVCAPFWCLLAALVKLESKGPVFYSQERVGHDGRTISVLKFRSMQEGAEAETGPVWAVREDPRRTRLGAWMRKYNIDETPQFLNVFRGEMSLVGPRPERPHFVNQFKEDIPSYLKRHMVKSGITGWAQVNGLRGDTSIEERTRYDMWYIQNWSLLLDLRILAKTLFAHENAH